MAKNDDNSPAIWVSVGITKNLGNYESARIDAGARINVDQIDDPDAWKRAWDTVNAEIESKLIEIAEALDDK